MGSTQGRFLSADPGSAGADPSNPQSWNGYSYVLNNPLTLIDPTAIARLALMVLRVMMNLEIAAEAVRQYMVGRRIRY